MQNLTLRLLARDEPGQSRLAAWVGFAYFFFLLSSYYVLRPVREMLGVSGGTKNLPWLFSATFAAMLLAVPAYGWICSRFPRRRFLPWVYGFFISHLLLFYGLLQSDINNLWVARGFFVWLSVFSLFTVSVFWSFMTDVFDKQLAQRLFGFISAGGSLGAMVGPLLATGLVGAIGPASLLLLSALLLALTLPCIHFLLRWQAGQTTDHSARFAGDQPVAGGVLSGLGLLLRSPYLLGISGFILLASANGTFLYLLQADFVANTFTDKTQQTQVFGAIDSVVNGLSILVQLIFTRRIIATLGAAWTLASIPIIMALGFAAFGWNPSLPLLLVLMILRRVGDYAILRPAREMLFAPLDRVTKYKAKNIIDTVVFRGGDALTSWLYAPFGALGIGLIAAVIASAWAGLGFVLGRRHQQTHR
jgi:AAA family ATP:ADP antiporter